MIRIDYRSLKQAFISECNRASNVSMGREYFQNYEVANFLNTAYVMCIKRRIGRPDERYISYDKRPTMPPMSTFPNSMEMLIEFGDLYQASGLLESRENEMKDEGLAEWACGEDTKMFLFPEWTVVNGFIPYIINANIHEYAGKVQKAVFLCRPVNVIDSTRMAQFFQEGKYVPYPYYRIRPIRTVVHHYFTKNSVNNHFVIEMAYHKRNGGDKFMFSFDGIIWPKPITAEDMDNGGDPKQVLQVAFGYEIAIQAAQLAMESLGSDRGHSLAQINATGAMPTGGGA